MRKVRSVVGRLPAQAELVFKQRGGARKGAGRKRQGPRTRVPHRRRETIDRHKPVHVTLRVLDSVGRLRRIDAYRAIRQAMRVAHRRENFRIVHISIQSNHIHLICESDSRQGLAKGMSSLKISAARRLNRVLRRKGEIFADRYHCEVLSGPRQTRNAICYVVNNWRRHKEDRGSAARVDGFSSAPSFRDWKEGPGTSRDPEPLPVKDAESWLLKVGWKKHPLISCYEVPGPR